MPRIMIVDDTPMNLHLLEMMLRERGYQVFALPNGEMALRAAARDQPDLILLDILMPGMDGLEVCARLKADPKLSEIPVLFLSALNEPWDKIRAFQAGGVDYIPKPFQLEELEARVRTHLELRRQKRELQDNLERVRNLERLRDSLVHMVVHDLRSPLSVIALTLDEVSQFIGSQDPEIAEMVETARQNAGRITKMIADMLDISRFEADQMPLDSKPGNLADLVRSAKENLIARKFGPSLSWRIADPVRAVFDFEIIGRVLGNLLENALKFTPGDGGIEVSLESLDDRARLAVKDSGPGIPQELHQRIFEKFAQIEKNQPLGTGLGLSFCKLAVEAHGGVIGVASEPGHGSIFWLTLPLLVEAR